MTRRLPAIAALTVLAATTLSACGGNAGGNTSCGDYRSSSTDDKKAVVTQMMKDHGDTMTPAAVDVTRASVAAYCFLHAADKHIDSIYHG